MLGALAALVVLVGLGGRSNGWSWIRDGDYGIPDQVLDPPHLRGPRPFSLGRSQMLFWTVAVASASLAIGMATGDWLNINETALILLGLGVGTALGSIATGVPQPIADQLKAYNDGVAADKVAAAQKLRELVTSKGNWFKDVWSDYGDARAGVHRLQSLLATLGFGVVFVHLAYRQGTMPAFTGMQLALLGISGTAYVGFKLAGKPA